MSRLDKLEQVYDLLVNEEVDQASELLHQFMVETARETYEELIQEEFGDEELGGDMKADFADEIEADKDEIEDDEVGADLEDHGDLEDEVEGEEEIEDRVEDLEAALAELTAEFDKLMGDDEALGDDDLEVDAEVDVDHEEDEFDFGDDDFGGDEAEFDEFEESLEEATKLQDEVPATGQESEGKLAGTGSKSKTGSTGKESPYTRIKPRTTEGEPTDFVGKDESGEKASKGKDHTPSSNVDVDHKDTGHSKDKQKSEGDLAGTGKGSKKAAVNTKSALGQSGSPRGE